MDKLAEMINNVGYIDFSNIKIAVIGDCMLDIYHYGTVDRISPEAPVPIFKTSNIEPEYRLGGACNTALNLAKLGVQTSLFGFVGKDSNASYIKSYLLENDINFHLHELSGFPTITKNRYFSKNQQIIRIDHENTDGRAYDRELQDKLWNYILNNAVRYDAIILSDYGKGALYHPVLNAILSHCHEYLPIFVDPKSNNWDFYKNAFCITPNWEEFKNACYAPNMPFDEDEITKYAQDKCIKHNIDYVLVTLGSKGMLLVGKEGFISRQNVKAEEVFDVSGAGDTVIAVLAAAYCKEYPMSVCTQLATHAAKVVIGHLGTYAITDSELKLELIKTYNNKRG